MEYTLVDLTNAQVELEEYSLVDLFDAQIEMGSDQVQLLSPSNGATGVSVIPAFSWRSFPDTETYTIRVWDYTGDVKGELIILWYVSGTEFTVPEPLQNSTKYLWQVEKATLLTGEEPEPTAEITGISISAGSTINIGGSRTFTISTTGTGDYNESYTVSGTGLTFSITGNQLTVTESGGTADTTKTFTVEAVEDNTVTDSRQLTLVDQGDIATNDSVQTDFEALQALYNETQGQYLPVYASTAERPSLTDVTYPYMCMINDEIHWVELDKDEGLRQWNVAGAPWKDTTGWTNMTAQTMGEAVGITTDADGRVTEIDMQKITIREGSTNGILTDGNNLAGHLPPEIGNLKRLKKLNIKQNYFHGELPSELGFIGTSLERLSLGGHYWEIDLDDGRLWLESMHNHYNRNGGSDPFSWSVAGGKSVSERNKFRSDLPAEWGNLTNLDIIELSHQFLTGSYPDEWGNLTNIRGLLIDSNRPGNNALLGELPDSWGNMTQMRYFRITGAISTTLNGVLPSGMLNWSNLVNFAVYRNELEGEFPGFANLTEMFYFNITSNNFGLASDGTRTEFPWNSIFNGNNSGLSKFAIARNNFTGELPATVPDAVFPQDRSNIGNRYAIDAFGINYNDFSGPIPNWVQELGGLQTFNVSYNNFTGGFPEKVMNKFNLKTFYIQGNNLSGSLPDRSWNTDRLIWFKMEENNFEGEIPDKWISFLLDHNNDSMPWSSYNNFTGTSATLTWPSVAGAVAYEVEIRIDAPGTDDDNKTIQRDRWMQTEQLVVSGLPSRSYKWRVRGLEWTPRARQFVLAGNNLTGRVPDWAINVDIDFWAFNNNRHTFKDVADSYAALKAAPVTFKISDQKPFGDEVTIQVSAGTTEVIDLSEYDTAGNTYEWLKNGNVLSDGGNISGATTHTLTITNFQESDESPYVLRVNNANYSDMGEIQSKPTNLLYQP